MAEECIYYYYDSGYSCEIKRDREGDSSINSDVVYKYCWGYHYEDCPLYKSTQSSGTGCFLTSACVEAKGLSDDCHELTVLRTFRYGYMRSTPEGGADICRYYHIAPTIVEKIKQQPDANSIFERIYDELVLPCVALIESGKLAQAHAEYRRYTEQLSAQYL